MRTPPATFAPLATLLALAPLPMLACSAAPAPPPDARDAGPADVADDLAAPNVQAPDVRAPACTDDAGPPPAAAPTPAIHTPRWAFEPWISKDISSTADTYDFVNGFRDRDIPVGTVVIDSPWETNYNTFVPNPARYPEFPRLVSDLRARNIRVVLWITQMVNRNSFDGETGATDIYASPSPNFTEAQRCGYFVNNGATYAWWKGIGAAVDFFNPRAAAWWHRQQDAVLDLGVAGWKLDFGESYVTTPMVSTATGMVPHQQYSEEYYRDFLAYGTARRGREEFTTMVRPWDESYQFAGRFFARPEHAPVAWVGDNRRDWVGIADALDEIFRSARAGYVMVGSDVGGYLDFDDHDMLGPRIPFDQTVFARWAGMSALLPFFQLHGRANITPWTVPERPDETVALYRYWSKLHHELVPFFYSLAEEAYATHGTPIVRPIGDEAQWAGDYRFQTGDAFLVAPVLDATGRRDVALPAGARWFDWWNPQTVYPGGQTLAAYDATDRARVPLFVREGAVVPALVSDPVTGLGTAGSAGAITWLLYPGAAASRFVLHDEDDATTEASAEASATTARVTLSRATRPVVLRLRTDTLAASVAVDGAALAEHADRASFDAATAGFFRDAAAHVTWIRMPAATTPRTVVATLR